MVGSWTTIIALLLAVAIRFPPEYEFPWERPRVALEQGHVVGRTVRSKDFEEKYAQEHFLGIPFAVPPLGQLRFQRPRPVPKNTMAIVDAGSHGKACMQPIASFRAEFTMQRDQVSEDCLTVNVVRPKGDLTNLPVMVWIYGGGWQSGSSGEYDGSAFVAQSVAIDKPIIYVSLNYRLNLFGFLVSSDIQERSKQRADVDLNVGYHDQRLALQWVQDNIAAFGGDPSKVTVFGESAGAISIGAHLLSEYHTPRKLFRAVILQSGASASAFSVEPSWYQPAYNKLLDIFSCSPSYRPTGDSIDCLRALPSDVLLQGMMIALNETFTDPTAIQTPFFQCQDGDFLRESGVAAMLNGRVSLVPAIIGTDLDEGTMWGHPDIDTDEKLKATISRQWTIRKTDKLNSKLEDILRLYPDDPTKGSPFPNPSGITLNTSISDGKSKSGQEFDFTSRIFEPLDTNQYKRNAAFAGDLIFESPRVLQLEAYGRKPKGAGLSSLWQNGKAGTTSKAWGYHFRQPIPGVPPQTGVYHGAELQFMFSTRSFDQTEEGELARAIMRAWVRFAVDLDPTGPEIPSWPAYETSSRNLIQFRAGNTTLVEDDFRQEALHWHFNDPDWVYAVGK